MRCRHFQPSGFNHHGATEGGVAFFTVGVSRKTVGLA